MRKETFQYIFQVYRKLQITDEHESIATLATLVFYAFSDKDAYQMVLPFVKELIERLNIPKEEKISMSASAINFYRYYDNIHEAIR